MKIWIVDAFSQRPFAGNPAAVVLLSGSVAPGWMQSVAAEMNLSETAFLEPPNATGVYPLRWFTPRIEVDLCGHATLASAHVLWSSNIAAAGRPLRFSTRSGTLTATQRDGLIELDFPSLPTSPAPIDPGIRQICGAQARIQAVARSAFDLLVELETAEQVRTIEPDLARLAELPFRGLIVTASAGAGWSDSDFVSRFFAPAAGISEDPVTGSAHCVLGPYWAEKLGRNELTGYQASKRGGTVRVRVVGERTVLGGHAVTVLEGTLQ